MKCGRLVSILSEGKPVRVSQGESFDMSMIVEVRGWLKGPGGGMVSGERCWRGRIIPVGVSVLRDE